MAEGSAQLAVDGASEGAPETAAAASKEAGQSNLVQDQQNQVQTSTRPNASSLLRATRCSGAGSGLTCLTVSSKIAVTTTVAKLLKCLEP